MNPDLVVAAVYVRMDLPGAIVQHLLTLTA